MRSVFIVGDSLFAEGIIQTLTVSEDIDVIGSAPTIEAALSLLKANCPDAVIIADTGEATTATFSPILTTYPNLSIIHADPGADNVQVITSQRVGTRKSDLLAAIADLPTQNSV